MAKSMETPPRIRSDSLETLHWLYSIEQRSVIPIKWLVLLLAVTLILIEDRTILREIAVITILVSYTVTNAIFTVLFLRRLLPVKNFRLASYLSLAADLGLVSSLILFAGELQSDFYLLFILLILRSAALFQDPLKKFACDLFMTIVYLGCVWWTIVTDTPGEEVAAVLFFRVTVIWAVVLISWFLLQVLTSQQARMFAINERLRYQMEQNREVLSSMTDAVMVFNRSLQLRLCNPSAENLLGELLGISTTHEPKTADERLNRLYWNQPPRLFRQTGQPPWDRGEEYNTFWSVLTPDQIASELERLLEEVRFASNRRIVGRPISLIDRSGSKRSLIASVAELGKSDEGRLGWVILLRDVSEFRSLEEQLLSSEKMAAVGKLAAGLAHELGNPLGIIKSCANYLLKKMDPESGLTEEVAVLGSEAARCERVLRQLLAFASQEQLHLDEIDLKDLLHNAVNLVSFQAPDQVKIVFQPELEIAPCHTDENLLTQAFVNLLLNAVESIEEAGEVEIRLRQVENEGLWVTIRDNGCGMGKESKARLFEPFYTTKASGTGLGCAITQRIIQRLQGSIAVQSEPGRGTEFSIILPRRTEGLEKGGGKS